jgi:tRNA wybutosine-synthesizing protein 3
MQNNFNHLVPDYEDSSKDILASFPSIRSKTLETLYYDADPDEESARRRRDKSPKGSVDDAIRDLVNLINAHPSFATLSSCSGRIALYDPLLARRTCSSSSTTAQSHEHKQDIGDSTDTIRPAAAAAATRSGKGGTGGWLLASHEVVEPTILVDLLQPTNNNNNNNGSSVMEPESADDEDAQITSSASDDEIIGDNANGSDDDDDDENDDHVLSFKMEPLLLHVAAANLTRGRQLLQVALSSAGLRESGLVVTESRVTVALRGQSLALSVPLARARRNRKSNIAAGVDCCLRPNDEYLVALVQQANRRLQRNLEKISHLFEAVQRQIFRPNNNNKSASFASVPAVTCCRIRASPLPTLNLWRHASVIVPSYRHFSSQERKRKQHVDDDDDYHHDYEEEMELLVFGGYGSGPTILNGNYVKGYDEADVCSYTTISPTRRSDKVYRLRRNMKGSWSEAWEEVTVVSTPNSGNNIGTNHETETQDIGATFKQNCLGLKVRSADFTAREGLAACLLSVSSSSTSSSSKDVIAIFGGRQGPNWPLNDLMFFDNTDHDNDGSMHQHSFQAPIDVRGTPPTARWGHSFTAISAPESNDSIKGGGRGDWGGEQRPMALVVGGRNDSQTFASIHILSLVVGFETNEINGQESSHAHLVWTEVMESAACRPRFYHAATAMSSTHDSRTFVFGGLWNAQNLLGGNELYGDTASLVVDATANTSMSTPVGIAYLPCPTPFDTLFGHSVSLLPGGQSNSNGTTYLSIGGIPRATEDECSDDAYLPIRCVTLKPPTAPPSPSSAALFVDQDKCKEDKLQLPNARGSWIVREHSVEFFSDDYNDSTRNNNDRLAMVNDLGCLVHHSCNVAQTRKGIINRKEFQVLVVGGGVQGFAFGPIFGKSHLLTVSMSSPNEGDVDPCTNAAMDDSALVERRAEAGHHGSAHIRIRAHIAPNGVNKNEQQRETSVLYVTAQDAKIVKTLLEEARLLDKEYRMGPAIVPSSLESPAETSTTTTTLIAVPVTPKCLDLLLRPENDGVRGHPTAAATWQPLVQGSGRQHMSFSSSVFAARRARKKECHALEN